MRVYSIHTGAEHTDSESAQHFWLRKTHNFFLCSWWGSNLGSLDLESDAPPIEPLHHFWDIDTVRKYTECYLSCYLNHVCLLKDRNDLVSSKVEDIVTVPHSLACSSYQPQRLKAPFVGVGHICDPTSRNESHGYFVRFSDFCSSVNSIEFSLQRCKTYRNRSTGFEGITT